MNEWKPDVVWFSRIILKNESKKSRDTNDKNDLTIGTRKLRRVSFTLISSQSVMCLSVRHQPEH